MFVRYSTALLLILGFVVIPLLAYVISRWALPRRYGRKVGVVLACVLMGLTGYGLTFGFEELEIHHVEYVSSDLPEAFDGYRIVQFSDIHLGSYTGRRLWVVERAVDSILAQHADMIVFTGDIQDFEPSEILPFNHMLSRLHAPDGIYSILGNHDYAVYQDADSATKRANTQLTQQYERQLGWTLLMNENRTIRRGADSLVLAGMENWGSVKRMPRQGDVAMTMQGIDSTSFVIMLQHDPSAWREKILPESHAQLTLSGHTHGMQFGFFGWSPMALFKEDWGGFVYEDDRALYVSTGLGGLVPFRLGMPGEITVITLRRK